MDAVLAADEIAINLPQTEAEIQVAANRFKEKSTHDVMTGYVGCVGAILICIKQPTDVDIDNPRA